MENPFDLFEIWFAEAQNIGLKEPTAMHLSTVSKDGKPSSRIILLKGHDERGFVFYTNSNSRKGGELAENPNVALCFYWMDLGKQIRTGGRGREVKGKEADEYFASRHPQSRLGAWASKQSQVMPSREEFLADVEKVREKFGDNPPRPEHWYGYRVNPERMEFWQEGEFRLHNRDIYEREGEGWKHYRIYP